MFPRCVSRLRRPADAEGIRCQGIAKSAAREMPLRYYFTLSKVLDLNASYCQDKISIF
jgi:hypothetical protein